MGRGASSRSSRSRSSPPATSGRTSASDHANGLDRRSELDAVESFFRAEWDVELRPAAHAADLHRRPPQVERPPQITLTGSIGGQSSTLSNLFSGPNGTWSFVPQLTQPIFTAGHLRSNVRLRSR